MIIRTTKSGIEVPTFETLERYFRALAKKEGHPEVRQWAEYAAREATTGKILEQVIRDIGRKKGLDSL